MSLIFPSNVPQSPNVSLHRKISATLELASVGAQPGTYKTTQINPQLELALPFARNEGLIRGRAKKKWLFRQVSTSAVKSL